MNTTRCHTLTRLLLSCLLLVLLTVTASSADAVTSGSCGAEGDGSNLTWTLDSDGVLTISGSGRMMDYSYYGCAPWYENRESVRMVNIGEGVTYIGDFAFRDCSSLTSVTIPEGVNSIGADVFYECSNLARATIPNSVTSIGDSVFEGCSSLTSVTIPNSVTSIGDSVFKGCSSLTSVTIPDSVTSIGSGAFESCSSLTSITIGSGVTSIGGRTFDRCSSLTNVYITDMNAWCRIKFKDSSATPMSYAKSIYLNGNKIVSIDVPQGVTAISSYAFCGFRDLIRVTIPNSVTSIGREAFSGCNSLISVTIPNSVTSIGYRAFYGCGSLTDVYITDISAWCSIDFGDSYATPMWCEGNFYLNGYKITSIEVPLGVTAINDYTFYGFKDLIRVTLPESVTSIGVYAFSYCRSLSEIVIPKKVTEIGYDAFYGCSSLTSVILPNDLTSISNYTFGGCTSLTSITIPDGVISIGGGAFYDCNKLTSITIPDSVTDIDLIAFRKSQKTGNVYITDVAAWCRINFKDNAANPLCCAKNLYVNGTKAETLEIPEGVQVISSKAFIGAECIKRVALPESLSGIAANAFSGCKNIEKVYYAGSESEWNALPISAGNDSLKNAQIYYNSTLDDYYCRIRVKVSDGGRIYMDRDTAEEGDTVTVTAAPYAGYELDAIYVDGAKIEGNTFVVTGNHEVSAVFTKLPVYGGTQDYRLEGITVQTTAGEKLQELAREKLLVSVSVRHTQGTDGATVMLAQYDAEGRYQGLVWLTLDEMPLDMALKVTLPVDNSDGKIVNLKAFVVGSILSPAPVGSAVSFGDV